MNLDERRGDQRPTSTFLCNRVAAIWGRRRRTARVKMENEPRRPTLIANINPTQDSLDWLGCGIRKMHNRQQPS